MRVRDLMSSPAIVARPDEPIADALVRLVEHRISMVPVLDDRRRIVGVLSRSDVLAAGGPARGRVEVVAVMTATVVAADADEDVRDAAGRMLRRGLRHLPVVERGVVVGVVSETDLVRMLVECDDEGIRARARGVVERFLTFSFGHDVRVDSACGVVTLEGCVATRADARALEALVRGLQGVAAVRNGLVPLASDPPDLFVRVHG